MCFRFLQYLACGIRAICILVFSCTCKLFEDWCRTMDELNEPGLGLLGREADFGAKVPFYPY